MVGGGLWWWVGGEQRSPEMGMEVRRWIAGDRDRPVLFIAQDEEDKREEKSQR